MGAAGRPSAGGMVSPAGTKKSTIPSPLHTHFLWLWPLWLWTPCFPLARSREEGEVRNHRGCFCLREGTGLDPAQSDTHPHSHSGRTQLTVSPLALCWSRQPGPHWQTLHCCVYPCAPTLPHSGSVVITYRARSLCVNGQRPFPAALEIFTVQETWNVLEPQITALKPC